MPTNNWSGLVIGVITVLAAGSPAGAAIHPVLVGETPGQFTPAGIVVELGDTVRWDWVAGLHNVESGVGGAHDGIFRSGKPTVDPSTTFDVTFDQAFLDANPMPGDAYPYYCINHVGNGMVGSVTVVSVPTVPEPDVVLYGQVFFDGVLQTGSDTDVEIIARVDGVANPVGTYAMGASGNVGDNYVLRIRLEWLPDEASQSDDAALIGQNVHIVIKEGDAEVFTEDFVVPDRGHVQNIVLHTPANGDADGDDVVGLSDHSVFAACVSGPGAAATPLCQAVFDFDSNSTVDLRDFSAFQAVFSGN